MKITFGKFDGYAYEDATKSIFVDDVEVGFIERQAIPTQGITSRSTTQVRVGGYQLAVLDGPEAAGPLLPLDGHEFETLGECQRAIKTAYTPIKETK